MITRRNLLRAGALAPLGFEANRNLEDAIDYIGPTGVIPRRFSADELFHPVTAALT